MIRLDSVSFNFRTTALFDKFNWQVQKGEAWAVLGPSGCGKSTLLSLLAGLRHPTGGSLSIYGQPLTRPRPQTGLILQDYGLLPWATVRQNVSLGLEIREFYGADGVHAPKEKPEAESVSVWLERLGLSSVAEKFPSQISGGQRQRAAIARTLVLNPDLLLMDEPFSSLDAPTRESLQELTSELVSEQKLTLILVTHSIEESALLGQKILLLKDPPHREPLIIDNSNASQPRFRESPAYPGLCKDLRLMMQTEKEIIT